MKVVVSPIRVSSWTASRGERNDHPRNLTATKKCPVCRQRSKTERHSRPNVSNDNPFCESAFNTFKYCPTFPERFGCIEDARAFSDVFFDNYNHVHRHSGIGLQTPASVHYGTDLEIREQRQAILSAAFEANQIRFRRIAPQAPTIPEVVWINPSIKEVLANI